MMNSEQPTSNIQHRTDGWGRRALEWAALACLLASPLLGPVLIGGSRLWASGPLMALAYLGALLVCLRALRWSDPAAALHLPPGALAWLGFLGYGTLAIFLYGTPYEARVELLRAASLWAAYWAWANLGGVGGRWRWVLGLVVLAAAANAIYGSYYHFMGTPERVLWFDRVAEAVDYGPRSSGTYFCPNHWASWLAMLAPVALALLFATEAGVWLRLLAAGALLTFLPAINFSQSRAGLVGLAAGLGVTVLALVWRRSRVGFALLLVLLPLLAAGGGYVYLQHAPAVKARFHEAVVEGKTGNGFRINQWRDTWLMIQARPWVGQGPGSYAWAVEAYRKHMRDPDHQALYAHNDYLHSVAEYGVVGTPLVALPLAWLLWRLLGAAWRRKTSATNAVLLAGLLGAWAAMLVHALFDFNLRIYANAATLAALSGLLAGRLQQERDWALPVARRALCVAGAAATALLLAVLGWTLISYYLEIHAAHAFTVPDYEAGERAARLALRVDGGNWYAADTLGSLLQSRARWGQDARERKADAEGAVQAFAQAARGNSRNMETRFEQGMALIECGRLEEGLQLIRQAADTNPLSEMYRSQLGVQLRQAGRYSEALAEFRAAGKITWNPMIRNNIDWLEQKVKKL
jgi:putative inorganic carbon (HCO3(-)) transporter